MTKETSESTISADDHQAEDSQSSASEDQFHPHGNLADNQVHSDNLSNEELSQFDKDLTQVSQQIPKETIKQQASPVYGGFDALTDHQVALQKILPNVYVIMLVLATLSMTNGFATEGFVPAINQMATDFNVDLHAIQSIIPIYILGIGIGQLFWGPFADRFGRKTIIIIGSIMAVATNLAVSLFNDYQMLQIARFVQGIAYSAIGVAPLIILKDIYSPRKFIIMNSWLITIFLFSPAIAPLLGGYIYIHYSWQMIFHGISILLIIMTIIFMISIPETIDPKLRQSFNPQRIISNYGSILSKPRSIMIIMINSIFTVTIFSFPTLLPAIYLNDYHVEPQIFGYYTFAQVIVVMFSIQTNKLLVSKGYNPFKIWLVASTIQLLTTGVNFFFAFADGGTYLSVTTIFIAISLNVLMNGLQIGNMMAIYMIDYPHIIGTASSLIASIRMLIPGVVVLWISQLNRNMGATLLYTNGLLIIASTLLTYVFALIWGKNYIQLGNKQQKSASK